MKHIAIHAPARSGKSTVAEIIRKEAQGVRVLEIALADPMKRLIRDVFNASEESLWGPSELRNEVPPDSNSSVRILLQTLGTEWGRAHGEDVWVNTLLRTVQTLQQGTLGEMGLLNYTPKLGVHPVRGAATWLPILAVVPDVRFENEAARLRATGFEIWHLRRTLPGATAEPWRAHASEGGVQVQPADVLMHNNGTLEELADTVRERLRRMEGWG